MAAADETIVRFELPDILSAALIPGKKRPLHGKMGSARSGDALLISAAAPLLAVADSPERNPGASSSFLARFHDGLAASLILTAEEGPIEETFTKIVDYVNGLLKTVNYHDSTTFSALILRQYRAETYGIMLHTGDSLLFRAARIGEKTSGMEQLTHTNHYLVGRSPIISQTEILTLHNTDRIILCSDGITDIARAQALGPGEFLARCAPDPTPPALLEGIIASAAESLIRLDDIGVICASVGPLMAAAHGACGERTILT